MTGKKNILASILGEEGEEDIIFGPDEGEEEDNQQLVEEEEQQEKQGDNNQIAEEEEEKEEQQEQEDYIINEPEISQDGSIIKIAKSTCFIYEPNLLQFEGLEPPDIKIARIHVYNLSKVYEYDISIDSFFGAGDDEIHRANVATTDIGVHSNVQEIQLNNFTFAESEIMFILSNFTSITSSSVISAAHTTLPVLDLCSSQVL